jgi:hypothetical protein
MILGMIVCSIMGIQLDQATMVLPMEMWLITAFISVLASIGATYWYFKGKNLKANAKHGLYFGTSIVIAGFLLDLLFFWSLSFQGFDPIMVLKGYYSQPMFWLTLALILAGSSGTGYWLESKKK